MKLCKISQNRLHKLHSKDFLICRSRPLNITQLILGAFFLAHLVYQYSTAVIDWFKAINNEPQETFFVSYFKNSYSSISLDLCEKILNFAEQIAPIADSDLRIMMYSTKTLLFHGRESFVKREGNEIFDVRVNRPKLCRNCSFPQNFHTRKLGKITVFFPVQCTNFECFLY